MTKINQKSKKSNSLVYFKMKSAVIYFSYRGNTKKVAEVLTELLSKEGLVEQIELIALDESKSFLGQCRRALSHLKAEINPVKIDLSGFDLISFGSPVWAFAPAPAMNTYLDLCTGLEGKEVLLFTTYGSGTGNARCLDYMQGMLAQKGVNKFSRFSIQQLRVQDKEFVIAKIKEIARLWLSAEILGT